MILPTALRLSSVHLHHAIVTCPLPYEEKRVPVARLNRGSETPDYQEISKDKAWRAGTRF